MRSQGHGFLHDSSTSRQQHANYSHCFLTFHFSLSSSHPSFLLSRPQFETFCLLFLPLYFLSSSLFLWMLLFTYVCIMMSFPSALNIFLSTPSFPNMSPLTHFLILLQFLFLLPSSLLLEFLTICLWARWVYWGSEHFWESLWLFSVLVCVCVSLCVHARLCARYSCCKKQPTFSVNVGWGVMSEKCWPTTTWDSQTHQVHASYWLSSALTLTVFFGC